MKPLQGNCPFDPASIVCIFMLDDDPLLIILTEMGHVWEQGYYSDRPEIYWFLLGLYVDNGWIDDERVATIRVTWRWSRPKGIVHIPPKLST